MSTTASLNKSRQGERRHQVVDLLAYRRKRLTAKYHGAHAWDNGVPGHLSALLGCARTLEESINAAHSSPDSLTALRYGFGLRRTRVESALNALTELTTTDIACEDLLHAIRELDTLLDTLHQSGGYMGGSDLTQVALKLARRVNEDLWTALFDASSLT